MTESRGFPPPRGLETRGRQLWKRIVSRYELRADEVILLESACRTFDLITKLEDAMRDQPLTVAGSMGQMREHPLLSEVRQQRALMGRIFAQLRLPDEEAVGRGSRSTQARAAAHVRWSKRGA